MQVDCLIIGQGICGTWLSHYLEKSGYSFLVIDEAKENSASKAAAGIINPVTGRRIVKTWMIDDILPFIMASYSQLGSELSIKTIEQKNIIDFFPTPQMKLSFTERSEKDPAYLKTPQNENSFRPYFNYDFGYGEIRPVYTVHLETLLPEWRQQLQEKNLLIEEEFDINQLQLKKGGIQYKTITAEKIIFCDGNNSSANPHFQQYFAFVWGKW